jgi:hypothetical protein
MKTYVTFGQQHVHRVCNQTLDRDCVAVIECSSASDGREKAFEYFGNKFCFRYFETDFDPEIMKYFPRGLIEV